MKKIFAVLFAVLSVVMFGSCTGEETEEERVTFTAVINVVDEDSLEVAPAEGSAELNSADRIRVALHEDLLYFDADGEEIDRPEFTVGQQIDIVYDGMIAESYPAQIHADEIHLTAAED
ncbi:MAG TPA: DUF3221 domain-containing protein [Oscillospiraceae bacterium]|nr:DUF3221 domain-containing protein [Oscillospiraceae bacterium]